MATNQLFIPEKIKVGFQDRTGTYTGRLAYIIYFDQKGVLRKEKSWQSWRDHKIDPLEFDNVPTEGFVLNKDVGGVKKSYGWNARNTYIRVYDPRNFEFEIDVENLLFILKECDCSRGKGLEGKFVYSWNGTSLVLLPTGCVDYKNSQEFTKLQDKKISAKEIIKGATYLDKNQEKWIYLGRFDRYRNHVDNSYGYGNTTNSEKKLKTKQHIFVNESGKYEMPSSVGKMSTCIQENPVHNYAELVNDYCKSVYGSKFISLELVDVKETDPAKNQYGLALYVKGVGLVTYQKNNLGYDSYQMCMRNIVELRDDGILSFKNHYRSLYPQNWLQKSNWHSQVGSNHVDWNQIPPQILIATAESGSKFHVCGTNLYKLENEDINSIELGTYR